MASILDPALGVVKAMDMRGSNYFGMCYGSMVGYASECIARMAPPEHGFVCLVYEEGL